MVVLSGPIWKRLQDGLHGRAILPTCLLLLSVTVPGCSRGNDGDPSHAGHRSQAGASDVPQRDTGFFTEVTEAMGLPAAGSDWPPGTFATPETTSGGVAFLDYDNDGRLDIYQICHPPPGTLDAPAPNRLFHQEPDGHFQEVELAAGLNDPGCGHGVAVGDYDNDGFVDVYVTNFGKNALYRNLGNGAFHNVTSAAGLLTDRDYWSSSAAFCDYDRDGDLDLYVCHFAEYEPDRVCPGNDGQQEYCGPSEFRGVTDTLYRNNGDGTFADVSARAGITYAGRGWGVIFADLTADGWVDIFVANDEEQQNLYVNRHDGTFVDEAILRGVAFSGFGKAEAGMGVAVGDIANDGRLSIFITHFQKEKNTLYVPSGHSPGYYVDGSAGGGMAAIDIPYTGWGCGFFDFDLDGSLDVALVNGRITRGPIHPRAALGEFWNRYAEKNLLFRGDGRGRFTDVTEQAGDFTRHVECTRGLAFGDFDNDGSVDLVSNTIGNRLRLFRNVAASAENHWLTVRALTGGRDAFGAQVDLCAGTRKWTRLVQAASSYCSSNDPRAHFGLGTVADVDCVEVGWPDGTRERFPIQRVDDQVTVHQGTGQHSIAADR